MVVVTVGLLAASIAMAFGGGKPTSPRLGVSLQRTDLAHAAVRIAGGRDTAALRSLADSLAAAPFLARLDDTANPQTATLNVREVFLALEGNPSAASERLCLKALASPAFAGNPSRPTHALAALAAVKPMSAAAESVFAASNVQGHYNSNGPLLAANGSPRAIGLLESMFADRGQALEDRIDLARRSIVPHRTRLSILQGVERLIERKDVEPGLAIALAECVFEYKPTVWYGKRRAPPEAPSWDAAPPDSRRAAKSLGDRLLASRHKLPDSLRAAIKSTLSRLK